MTTNNITNNYGVSSFIVDSTPGNGDYTTIQSAINAASSGQHIFIRPGTYTENLTLKAGVNLHAFRGDAINGIVIIVGNHTYTATGTTTISGIQLKTNSGFFLTVSGSNICIVNLVDCNLICSNNTGISFTNSNNGSSILCQVCTGDLQTTGIAFHTMSAAGTLTYQYCNFTNSGASTTQSTNSAGIAQYFYCLWLSPISCSGTGVFLKDYTFIDTSALNVTPLTIAGTGTSVLRYSDNKSGTAVGVTIGTGATLNMFTAIVDSNNTNAITGLGTLKYGMVNFTGSSAVITTTTQNAIPWSAVGGLIDNNGNNLIGFTAAASAVNYVGIGNAATGQNPLISATGSDTNISFTFTSKGTGNINFTSNNTANLIVSFVAVASSVNYITMNGNTTTNPPYILTGGSDTNVGLVISTKGTGVLQLFSGSVGNVLAQFIPVASAVDYFTFTSAATANPATITMAANGTDSNINIALTPLGTGKLRINGTASFSANGSVATLLGSLGPTGASTTVTKWLTILDNGGATHYIPCF